MPKGRPPKAKQSVTLTKWIAEMSAIATEMEEAGRGDLAERIREQIAEGKIQPLDDQTSKEVVNYQLKSQLQRYHAEPHYWITFHRMGDDDNVDTVYIGAAGVSYNIRKGERVLLPQSAINVLKDAVRVGLDYGHPVEMNGKKYLRKIRSSEYSYTIEGQVSPEEAAEWRKEQARKNRPAQEMDLVPQESGENDLVEVGRI